MKKIVTIILLTVTLFTLASCSSGGNSSKSNVCAYCNGVGYVGNGAKNGVEFELKKTVCPRCHGTGRIGN